MIYLPSFVRIGTWYFDMTKNSRLFDSIKGYKISNARNPPKIALQHHRVIHLDSDSLTYLWGIYFCRIFWGTTRPHISGSSAPVKSPPQYPVAWTEANEGHGGFTPVVVAETHRAWARKVVGSKVTAWSEMTGPISQPFSLHLCLPRFGSQNEQRILDFWLLSPIRKLVITMESTSM